MTKGSRVHPTAIAEDRARPLPPPHRDDDGVGGRTATTPGDRWAQLVVAGATSAEPVASLDDWAHVVRLSPRTLRNRCRAAGLRAKASLDFTRLLRIVVHCSNPAQTRFADALEDCDPRTIARLMRESGLVESSAVPDLASFLERQSFVLHASAIAAVSAHLTRLLT
jgi:hypothetical protein